MTQTRQSKDSAKSSSGKPGKRDLAQKGRKKTKRSVTDGIAHVGATFNNTLVTITDLSGATLTWATSAMLGYRGSRKSTPFAAGEAATKAASEAIANYGLKNVDVVIIGPGAGRESAVRALSAAGLTVKSIKDGTGVPHNGCRPPKKRRV